MKCTDDGLAAVQRLVVGVPPHVVAAVAVQVQQAGIEGRARQSLQPLLGGQNTVNCQSA